MREKEIIFVQSRRAQTSRRSDLLALPGQTLKGEAVSVTVEVTGSPAERDAMRRFWKSYPLGTVFAAEDVRFERRSSGGRYEAKRLFPVSETPFSLFDAPSESIMKTYRDYVKNHEVKR